MDGFANVGNRRCRLAHCGVELKFGGSLYLEQINQNIKYDVLIQKCRDLLFVTANLLDRYIFH